MLPLLVLSVLLVLWILDVRALLHGHGIHPRYLIDTDVYRAGGRALLDGVPLYEGGFTLHFGDSLPFTYPPFATILFAPLAKLPLGFTMILVTITSVLALWLACFLVLRVALPSRDIKTLSLWATAFAGCTEPVYQTISFGQVNLYLGLLVLVDVLALGAYRRGRFQGILVGIAMAIKLTPAVFLAVFFVRRQWQAFITTLASFIGCGLIGFAITPTNSLQYWTETIRESQRIGGLAFVGNQSLRGFLSRTFPAHAEALWLGGVVLIVALIWVLMELVAKRFDGSNGDLVLTFLAASVALLCSPVSWSHHFVWLTYLAIFLFAVGKLRLGALTATVILACGHWQVPKEHDIELTWNLWQAILGNDYVILTVALLAITAWKVFGSHQQN